MDDTEISISQEDLARLPAHEQQQLQNFLESESKKTLVQKNIHELTEICFKKCITGSISGGKLAGKEESCMSNCVDRFMDSNLAVLKHLDTLRASQ